MASHPSWQIEGKTMETVMDFILEGSKITADDYSDYSHEIKRLLLLGRKAMINLQFSSVTQLCLTLCDHMNCSTPGLSVYHQLLEFTQIYVH